MKFAKGRKRIELCRWRPKTAKTAFTPSGFLCNINVNLRKWKKKTYSSIWVFLSLSRPTCKFFSSRFSLRQFACVQERKEVNTYMRTILRNCLVEQWSCAWNSSKVVSQKPRRSENHLNGTLRNLLESFLGSGVVMTSIKRGSEEYCLWDLNVNEIFWSYMGDRERLKKFLKNFGKFFKPSCKFKNFNALNLQKRQDLFSRLFFIQT